MPEENTAAPVIRHYIAGGLEHGGGIGRLVGYVVNSPDTGFSHVVQDTRGSRWSYLQSPAWLIRAMCVIAADSVHGKGTLQHFHIAGRGSTARKLVLGAWARLLGVPYILHLHDYDYAADIARRPHWQFRAIRKLFQGAEHVIVLGRRDRSTVSYALDVPAARVSVLRNCVPDPGPRPSARKKSVGILFLGRLGPRKGVPELLAALADPAMPARGWHATLAGDGPVERYSAEAMRLGLTTQVKFSGWVGADEASRLRAEADILVLPSHAEGFAMAVLEGLAEGLAVVTTRVGAHDEVLVDGRNSLLVPPGNVRSLADAISRLVGDPELRERIGNEGRRLYLSQFTMQGYVHNLEALYARHSCVGQPVPRSA